ncbi:hypothetical protein [Oceanobacillus saliphilus]|uniref:hypothetical protein n=1 Tax=Oceanobacillus saliphilus TaxID=2925834 RepID=UPI00201D7C0A|nr:hypothetical protein [Oceanobacillus saliphilus]
MTKKTIIDLSENPKFDPEDLELSSDYLEFITENWHTKVPETRGYTVCPMQEATHVVFSELDLALAEEHGENFSINELYPIKKVEESGGTFIVDDKGQAIIGFDLYIPCEYLKKVEEKEDTDYSNVALPSNVVSLSDYKNRKK